MRVSKGLVGFVGGSGFTWFTMYPIRGDESSTLFLIVSQIKDLDSFEFTALYLELECVAMLMVDLTLDINKRKLQYFRCEQVLSL